MLFAQGTWEIGKHLLNSIELIDFSKVIIQIFIGYIYCAEECATYAVKAGKPHQTRTVIWNQIRHLVLIINSNNILQSINELNKST